MNSHYFDEAAVENKRINSHDFDAAVIWMTKGLYFACYNAPMLNLHKIIIEHFVEELRTAYYEMYHVMEPEYGNVVEWTGRLALENMANSDALYHNVEHTMMVVSVGQTILKGKHLCEGGVSPKDWMHFTMALLCHDIGYVRGVCRLDGNGRYATGIGDETVEVPPHGTDATMTPYHVDRSMTFVRERFGNTLMTAVDIERINAYIAMTRFPIREEDMDIDKAAYPALARAADFIGQLGDPGYLRKVPALFYEFEEIGKNKQMGHKTPGDLRNDFTAFYWGIVRSHIEEALRYLNITHEGRQWIANLHSHVFHTEHGGI